MMMKVLNWIAGFVAATLAGAVMWLAIFSIAVVWGPL